MKLDYIYCKHVAVYFVNSLTTKLKKKKKVHAKKKKKKIKILSGI